MDLRSCVRAAALAAAVVSFAAPAVGQITSAGQLSEAQRGEMYCVRHELEKQGDLMFAVAEAIMYDDPTDEVEEAVAEVSEACKARHKWDEDRFSLALEIGLESAIMQYLAEELFADGVKDEHLSALDRVIAKLSREDLEHFLDDGVADDEAFADRLDKLLIAEKFPNTGAYTLETARVMIQTHVVQSVAINEWLGAYINKKN